MRIVEGRIDVGGRRLWTRLLGSGAVAGVFEAGHGLGAASFGEVPERVAAFARVCLYDRAGIGASDPGAGPSTCAQVARDLRTLLGAAGVPGPYVLVGHSLGGLHVRVFAQRYAAEVAGLVLVDPAHEDHEELIAARLSPATRAWLEAGRARIQAIEPIDWEACAAEARASGPLGDLPLVVLSHGRAIPAAVEVIDLAPGGEALLDDLTRALEVERASAEVVLRLHPRLAALSTRGRHVFVPGVGHMIPLQAPDAVVAAIREVVAAV